MMEHYWTNSLSTIGKIPRNLKNKVKGIFSRLPDNLQDVGAFACKAYLSTLGFFIMTGMNIAAAFIFKPALKATGRKYFQFIQEQFLEGKIGNRVYKFLCSDEKVAELKAAKLENMNSFNKRHNIPIQHYALSYEDFQAAKKHFNLKKYEHKLAQAVVKEQRKQGEEVRDKEHLEQLIEYKFRNEKINIALSGRNVEQLENKVTRLAKIIMKDKPEQAEAKKVTLAKPEISAEIKQVKATPMKSRLKAAAQRAEEFNKTILEKERSSYLVR